MTEGRQRVMLTVGLAILVASAAVSAATLGPAARRMPLVVALPTLALLIFELTRQARCAAVQPSDPMTRQVEAATFAWLGALLAGVWLLGMLAGLPLFLVSYLRSRSREPWAVVLGMGLGTWILLFVVLDQALGIQMHEGVLGSWLGAWRRP
jgi:hypothetical protein